MADAMILTSRHAAILIIVDTEQAELLDKPCYVVGDATAKAASQAGFMIFISLVVMATPCWSGAVI